MRFFHLYTVWAIVTHITWWNHMTSATDRNQTTYFKGLKFIGNFWDHHRGRFSADRSILWCYLKAAYANMRGNMPLGTKVYVNFLEHRGPRFTQNPKRKFYTIYTMLYSGFLWTRRRSRKLAYDMVQSGISFFSWLTNIVFTWLQSRDVLSKPLLSLI